MAEARTKPLRALPPGPKLYPGFDEMRAALLAVLDLHPADRPHPCMVWNDWEQHHWFTSDCPTKQAIAEKLGISLTG